MPWLSDSHVSRMAAEPMNVRAGDGSGAVDDSAAGYAWHAGAYAGEPGQEWPAWDASAQVKPIPGTRLCHVVLSNARTEPLLCLGAAGCGQPPQKIDRCWGDVKQDATSCSQIPC